ncbi:hypothetical protein ACFWR9_38930, partial [Streptomyces sp. NPDC058534]
GSEGPKPSSPAQHHFQKLPYDQLHFMFRTHQTLAIFVWRRVARWWMRLHRWSWTDLRRHLTDHTGRWQMPSSDGVELFNLGRVPTERYRYRGNKIPNPWTLANHA